MTHLLEVKDLKISFDTDAGEVQAVKNASFFVKKGEIFGIVGESGSGKSVATKSILRLGTNNCRIKAGTITFQEQNIRELSQKELRNVRGNQISMIFQDSLSALNPVYTVGNKMVELIRRHTPMPKKLAKEKVLALLQDVGITDLERCFHSYPHELSGGMRQRIMIGMAISCNPQLMIADEPTTALDVTIQAQILHLLRDIQRKRGMSIILITHDLGVVAQMCKRVAVMCGGYVVEEGNVQDIFHHPRHPYTQALIASMPKVGGGKFDLFLERSRIEENDSARCPFYDRCTKAVDLCSKEMPQVQVDNKEHCVRCHRREDSFNGTEFDSSRRSGNTI